MKIRDFYFPKNAKIWFTTAFGGAGGGASTHHHRNYA